MMKNLRKVKKELSLRLDALESEQYGALKKCITEGGGLRLQEGIDEKWQIRVSLEDALEFLFQDCVKSGADFEATIANWKGGDWETTLACLLLQGNLEVIRRTADQV